MSSSNTQTNGHHLSASIYVGDLSPDVSEAKLFEVFNSVGPVASIRVCRDTLTRRSLGYAYINFHNMLDAERALDTLNNTLINDKPCRIMWVQRDPSIRKSGVGNIFIKNLDQTIGHKELYDTFSIFGNILSCKVVMDENGESKGYGFVHFESAESADASVKVVNGKVLRTKRVYVGNFVPKREFAKQKENSWTNVYIKEIDPSVTEEQLLQKFVQEVCDGDPSAITSCVIMKDSNQMSRGFGFINFAKHELALKAVEKLQNTQIGSKNIWCGRAQKLTERQEELKKKYNQIKMQRISKYQGINLYVKNLEEEVNSDRLMKEFSTFGTIRSCKIMSDENGNNKGFGFVCYTSPEEAQRAITEMNSRILQGCSKPLYVALHEPAEVRKQKLAIRNARNKGMHYANNQPLYYSNGYGYPPQMAPRPQNWNQYPPNYGGQPHQMNTHRGRGRGNGMGGRGYNRRGHNQPAPVQMQDPSIIHVSPPTPMMSDLSLQKLMQLPLDQQKIALGERLYPLIFKSQPQLSGKITGMFLDSGWPVDELYEMIENESKLNDKITQALEVLKSADADEAEKSPVPQEVAVAH